MALTPQDIESQHVAKAASLVRELEKEIDGRLSAGYRPADRNKVLILVSAPKWEYRDVAAQVTALYIRSWTIEVNQNRPSTKVQLLFSPKGSKSRSTNPLDS